MSVVTNVRGMLFIVDGSENNILQIVTKINPQFVCFVATSNENLEYAVAIGKQIKEKSPQASMNYDRVDKPDTVRLFHALYRSLMWLRANEIVESEIGVGLTGREEKTIATSGIFASFFGLCSYYYIPRSTTSEEKVLILANPDDISGFIDIRSAVSHFNVFDYSHASVIFKSLMGKSSSLKTKTILESILWLSDAYLEWDSFRHFQAASRIHGCVEKMKECLPELGPEAQEFMKNLKKNLNFVSKLSSQLEKKGRTSPLLALDLFLNGQRRYYERNCNDAIVRLYRALECCTQHRLISKYGVDPASFIKTCQKIEKTKLEKFLRSSKCVEPPYSLGLKDSVALLRILEDPFVSKIDDNYLRKLMSSRNYCILAHGFDVIKDETFLEFAREVEGILKMLFEVENLSFETEKTAATHVSLDSEMLNRFLFA